MAEALLRHIRGDRYEVFSAGTDPTGVDPTAEMVLREIGVDTSPLRSKSVDEFLDRDIDLVITVCDHAKEACPFFTSGKERIHMGFRDPPDLVKNGMTRMGAFRLIRDEIDDFIREYFQ
jgi:arsenate reductase